MTDVTVTHETPQNQPGPSREPDGTIKDQSPPLNPEGKTTPAQTDGSTDTDGTSFLTAKQPKAEGEVEPKVEGGNTKPQTWTNWPDFSKRLDALTAATDDLAKAAASGGVAAAGSKVQAALTCKACHDQYLAPKKTP